jgi:hypothetical protein
MDNTDEKLKKRASDSLLTEESKPQSFIEYQAQNAYDLQVVHNILKLLAVSVLINIGLFITLSILLTKIVSIKPFKQGELNRLYISVLELTYKEDNGYITVGLNSFNGDNSCHITEISMDSVFKAFEINCNELIKFRVSGLIVL